MLDMRHMSGQNQNRVIDWLITERENGGLLIDPPFQRGSVWTEAQRVAWIETIIDDLPRPPLFLNHGDYEAGAYGDKLVVIDGRQRLEAIFAFVDNALVVRGERWTDQPERFHRRFALAVCPVVLTSFATEAECIALYLRLLRCGTAHTEADVQRAQAELEAATAAKE